MLGKPYQDLSASLAALGFAKHSNGVDHALAAKAQVYRLIRHKLVHAEAYADDPAWVEEQIRYRVETDRRFKAFSSNEQLALTKQIFESAEARAKRPPNSPVLFFHALFSLGVFSKFAKEVDLTLG